MTFRGSARLVGFVPTTLSKRKPPCGSEDVASKRLAKYYRDGLSVFECPFLLPWSDLFGDYY